MAEMDQGIKRLLQMRAADVLEYVLPGAHFLNPIPTDLATEPQLILDTLYAIAYEGVRCAVNIEAQTSADPDMPRRSFEYAARAMIIHQIPVISVVLWLTKKGAIPHSPYEMRAGSLLLGTWNFINVEVYALSAHDIMRKGAIGLLPLVPLMQDADQAVDTDAMRHLQTTIASDQGKNMAALLAVFIARRLGKDIAEAIVREVFMSTELLDESPLYREWVSRAEAKGKIVGQAEGMRKSAQLVLEARFGALPVELLAALHAADETLLTEIISHSPTDTLAQVRERLHLPAEK